MVRFQLQERRNRAYRRDRSAGIRPVLRKPGVELQEKAKQFRSMYFKPDLPIPLSWTDEGRSEMGGGGWSNEKKSARSANYEEQPQASQSSSIIATDRRHR